MTPFRFSIFDFRSTTRGRRGRARGFTLIEVLVSLTIFALAAIVLGGAYVNVLVGYDVVARSNRADADLTFARSRVLLEADVKKLAEGGEFDTTDNRHGRWSAEVTPTTTADLFSVAFTCEISEPTGGEPLKITETFMLLRPTWSIDAGERGKLREDAKKRIFELQGKKT